MRLILIAAEAREFDGLIERLGKVQKLRLPGARFARMAELNGRTLILAANGPGTRLADEAAEATGGFRGLSAMVSYGFCGALDPALEPGQIFIASEVLGAGAALSPAACPGGHRSGKLVTVDRVAATAEEKAALRRTGARAVEMEAAAVARKAAAWNAPFYCIRVVTDGADEGFAIDFNRMRDASGRFSRARILAAACRRPATLFPELMRLRRIGQSASRALGEFIAHCQF